MKQNKVYYMSSDVEKVFIPSLKWVVKIKINLISNCSNYFQRIALQ